MLRSRQCLRGAVISQWRHAVWKVSIISQTLYTIMKFNVQGSPLRRQSYHLIYWTSQVRFWRESASKVIWPDDQTCIEISDTAGQYPQYPHTMPPLITSSTVAEWLEEELACHTVESLISFKRATNVLLLRCLRMCMLKAPKVTYLT